MEDSKSTRLAKNTVFLYIRLLIVMGLALYTSRIVLSALGIEDFGIYNAVGGFVALFSFIRTSFSTGVSRYITFELGKYNKEGVIRTYSMSLQIVVLISLILVFILEGGGIWFLNNKMTIPEERLYAANWVFQLSVLTFVVSFLSIPYNAAIIAYERMGAFAYISIIDAVLKIMIAGVLLFYGYDRLILYAVLMCLETVLIQAVYVVYCRKRVEGCCYRYVRDSRMFKAIFMFTSWNFIGSSAGVLRDQGVNILLNIYFGPAVNAARGLAMQVNSAISQFATGFTTALNPQITKAYAVSDTVYLNKLLYFGAKNSFVLLVLLSFPIIIDPDTPLQLWLGIVPEYAGIFTTLSLIHALVESMSIPLITLMLATGDIKVYQLVVGGLNLAVFPICYVMLELGYTPESTFVVAILSAGVNMLTRMYMSKLKAKLDFSEYLYNVVLRPVVACFGIFTVEWLISSVMATGLLRLIVLYAVNILVVPAISYTIVFNSYERGLLITKLKTYLHKSDKS